MRKVREWLCNISELKKEEEDFKKEKSTQQQSTMLSNTLGTQK